MSNSRKIRYKFQEEETPAEEESLSLPALKLDLSKLFQVPQPEEEGKVNHIYFYKDVEIDTCLQLCQKIRNVSRKLEELALQYDLVEPPKIYLHISSYGGDLFAAFNVVDCILQSKIEIVTIVEGGVASAGTIIASCGHQRWMGEHAYYLIHQLRSVHWGTMMELTDQFKNNLEVTRRIKNHYIRFSDGLLTDKKLDGILKHDLWWTAKDVMEYGLIDRVMTGNLDGIGNCVNERRSKRVERNERKRKPGGLSESE